MSDTDVFTHRYDERTVEGKPLGRHVEHDPASLAYDVEAGVTAEERAAVKAVLWPRLAAILNQGQLGSCTGNALTGALASRPGVTEAQAVGYVETFAVVRYERATQVDAYRGTYPPTDTGSSGLGVCKAAKADGFLTGYTHALTVNGLVLALQRGPVIVGIPWYDGFDDPDSSGLVKVAGSVRGGHEFVIRGVQPATAGGPLDGSALLRPDNSWGDGWGDAGSFSFTLDTWAELRSQKADCTVPLFTAAA